MRMFAWVWRMDPCLQTVTRTISRMLQASTTHADLVHIRTVLSLSFLRGSAPGVAWPGRRRQETVREGKDLGRRHLRQVGTPDSLRVGAAYQPQQHEGQQRGQSGAKACLDAACAAPGAARAGGPVGAAARARRQPGERLRGRWRRT